jgi:protein-tyrosine phosphatase
MSPPRIYWVKSHVIGRLAVVSRPREARHFAEMKAGGIDVLVSMQEEEEAAAVGLADQAERCRAAGITFYNLPILDHGIPRKVDDIAELSARLRQHLARGEGVAAHCYAGLGRSPLMIAAVMIDSGVESYAACDLISEARGQDVPEMSTQVEWLLAYELRQRPR